MIDSTVEQIVFGCAKLMRISSRKRREELLKACLDCGIKRFDVARMYGMGMAERELRVVTKADREHISIATKFGIDVGRIQAKVAPYQGVIRALVEKTPLLRRGLSSALSIRNRNRTSHVEPKHFSAPQASLSLSRSLEELGTDYVDEFYFHEPQMVDLIDSSIWEWLATMKNDGVVRNIGLSGEPAAIASHLPNATGFDLIAQYQCQPDLSTPAFGNKVHRNHTFGIYGALTTSMRDRVKVASQKFATIFSGSDVGTTEVLALTLVAMHRHEGLKGLLYSTGSVDRLQQLTRAVRLVENADIDLGNWLGHPDTGIG